MLDNCELLVENLNKRSIKNRKKCDFEFVLEKNNRIEIPHLKGFDFVIGGGSCRDQLMGIDCKDYDIYFWDKKQYFNAVRNLCYAGFQMKESRMMDSIIGDHSSSMIWAKYTFDGKKDIDIFLLKEDTVEDIILRLWSFFDFRINCCFQVNGSHEIIIEKRGLKDLKLKQLNHNSSCNSHIFAYLRRLDKFSSQGFSIEDSCIDSALGMCSLLFSQNESDYSNLLRTYGAKYIKEYFDIEISKYQNPFLGSGLEAKEVAYQRVILKKDKLFSTICRYLSPEKIMMLGLQSHQYKQRFFDELISFWKEWNSDKNTPIED